MACGDEITPVVEPPVEEIEVFELQWATSLNIFKEIVNLNNGKEYKDWYIYTGDSGDVPTIMAFNKVTGEKNWEYLHNGIVNSEIDESEVFSNIYLGVCSDGIVAIDIENQELLWELNFDTYDYHRRKSSIVDNGYLYQNVSIGGAGLNSNAAAILKIDIVTGDLEEAYESANDLEGLKSLSPVVISEMDGNTILYFNERPNAELPPQDVRQQIVAYNIDTQEVLWKSDVTNGFASNSLHPPIIYQDLVITGGDWSMYAFDIHTGVQRWKTEVSPESQVGNWTKTNHLIHEDRLYVNQTESHIACLNPLTGDFIWDSTDAPNCTDNMLYYEKEDYLVFTSWGNGSVMILDALTGETIHREHRYDNSQYNNDVVYDEALDMFFTSTYKHAIGFKINATE